MTTPSDSPGPDGWAQTYTGRAVVPLALRPADVDLLDIAHALSQLCRFGGHSLEHYSVAQHCVHVAQWGMRNACPGWGPDAPPVRPHALDNAHRRLLGALLVHDSAEAYLGDLVAPVKRDWRLADYSKAEAEALTAVHRALGLSGVEFEAQVKSADLAVLAAESARFMVHPPPHDWGLPHSPTAARKAFPARWRAWPPLVAREAWLVWARAARLPGAEAALGRHYRDLAARRAAQGVPR